MDKFKKYYGILIFIITIVAVAFAAYKLITPKIQDIADLDDKIVKQQNLLESKRKEQKIVENKLKQLQDSIATSQKKVYSPIESDLGDDTLFFTLYNDTLDMVRANSVKIKSIDYVYNPSDDNFVTAGKDKYFVCDVKMDLISNFVNLGKLIQDIYQYPYFTKIESLSIKPYEKDKKILLTKLTLRLYAHTDPVD